MYPFVHWSPAFISYLDSLEPGKAVIVFSLYLFILFMLPLPVVIYSLSLAVRIIKSDRFPPPGKKTIRDTVVLKGKQARRRRYLMIANALFLLVLMVIGSIFSPVYIYHFD